MTVPAREHAVELRAARKAAYRVGFFHGFLGGFFGLALIGNLMSCTTIAHASAPQGWPVLAVHEHRVSFAEMYARCKQYVGWGNIPLACAEWNFDIGRCDIWYVWSFTLDHERRHCRGEDHPGSTHVADSLTEWRKGRGQ